jgi:tetratricopeptide (TPR) repeat protein
MTPDSEAALDIARRIADGEVVDLSALEAQEPALARRLARLQALARTMQPGHGAGATWGHLQQLQLAGEGGFGAVYRAYDPTLDRSVALKLRHADADTLLPSGRDFVAEARRLARVRHPNVLAVHGASYHAGRAGLWADWIDGETLATRLRRVGPLPRDELLRVLAELADAVDAVHRSGLVHGDITASNVMLDAQGRVILMDFGAGFESSDEGTVVNTGTPHYLAPEVAAGTPATTAVDLYALGVLAHRLATGRYPEAGSMRSLRPRTLRPLVAQLIDPQPRHRPSAAQVRLLIRRLVDAPRVRTRRMLVGAVIVSVAGVALATAVGLRREQTQRRVAELARDESAATATFLADILAAPAPEASGRDVRVVELLESAVQRAQTEPGLSPATRAALLLAIGRSQLALAQFSDAEATLSQAFALDSVVSPLDGAQALEIGLSLTLAHARRRLYSDADGVLRRLAQDLRWQGDRQSQARIQIARADWWLTQGKLDEAEKTLAPVLDSPTLPVSVRIGALVTNGQIQFDQGRLADAGESSRAALALLSEAGERFGTGEFELRLMQANVTTAMGDAVAGEAIYRELAAKVEETYGGNSLILPSVWSNVAITLNQQGRYEEALQVLREWMPRVNAQDSGRNSIHLIMRSNLAVALQQSGDLEAAMVELEALVEDTSTRLGPSHPNTLIARFNRVETLNDAGRNALALGDATELRAVMAQALGEGHPFTLETDDAIGFALTRLGRAPEAETLHRRTILAKGKALGEDNPYTLLSREYLARALIAQHRHDEARTLLGELLVDRERVLGRDHDKTARTRALLESVDGN